MLRFRIFLCGHFFVFDQFEMLCKNSTLILLPQALLSLIVESRRVSIFRLVENRKMAYNDRNRAFLQAFMGRSTLTFEEAQPVLAAILSVGGERVDPTDVTEDQFYAYLDAANRAISQFDLEIRSSLPQDPQAQEDPPQRVWALVNNTSDPLTQLATTYTADEVAFIKRLLDYMFLTNNTVRTEGMCVAQLQAVGLHKAPTTRPATDEPSQTQSAASQSLTMTQAEKTIRNLIEEGWFQKSRKGYLTLTPRALMELRGWLAMEYNDEESTKIRFCAACKDMVTVGQRCADINCEGRLHDHCIRNFFRMQQAEKCPVCQAEWPGDHFVGERAINTSSRPSGVVRRSTPASSRPSVEPSTRSTPSRMVLEQNLDEDSE
ncbi:unnamed protein product [Penicillium salamii]|uniref:Non-structural maintenance of chromosomes element 1 homolog n=1 Tax=Penicillium salamii TaxID=1612424 RepID=A0A9W4NUH1_9EURO|nr:unnamed protein product [Penicillium salamii]CAG8209771.1 unnamed protein product [Penicillium salamii]CAG8210044.1 unnamed protein product [Penicillium salamii]CAG8212806.1 unnamed protein product [Penicillium salamii]CAG8219208.1 unnamed protein product [Penicillium salamii]